MSVLLVYEHGRDLQMRSLLLHLGGDAVSSFVVVVVGVIVAVTGRFAVLDPLLAIGSAA